MDVMSTGRDSRAASDASSDWGDWADRQVEAQTPRDPGAAGEAAEVSAVDSSGNDEQDDQWVRQQMEQPSAVLGADNRAWDYVLQQIVLDELGKVCRHRLGVFTLLLLETKVDVVHSIRRVFTHIRNNANSSLKTRVVVESSVQTSLPTCTSI